MPVGYGLKEGRGGERDGTGGKLKTEIGLLCRTMTRYCFGKRGDGEGAGIHSVMVTQTRVFV